mgnify:CR=1 FL=1
MSIKVLLLSWLITVASQASDFSPIVKSVESSLQLYETARQMKQHKQQLQQAPGKMSVMTYLLQRFYGKAYPKIKPLVVDVTGIQMHQETLVLTGLDQHGSQQTVPIQWRKIGKKTPSHRNKQLMHQKRHEADFQREQQLSLVMNQLWGQQDDEDQNGLLTNPMMTPFLLKQYQQNNQQPVRNQSGKTMGDKIMFSGENKFRYDGKNRDKELSCIPDWGDRGTVICRNGDQLSP